MNNSLGLDLLFYSTLSRTYCSQKDQRNTVVEVDFEEY